MEENNKLVESEPLTPLSLKVEIAASTDRGLVRPSNEDCYVVLQGADVPLWCSAVAAVFDGVGGLSHGEEARSRAAKYLPELLMDLSMQRAQLEEPEKVVGELMLGLHNRLKADRAQEPALMTMATTATVALLTRASPAILWIGHVGDSPVLRLRAGSMNKLIAEDSLVAGMLRAGLINAEEAQRHPQRHVITQALGHSPEVNPHVSAHEVSPGDVYLLCTDGLTNMLPESRILEIMAVGSPSTACQGLIAAANSAGGADNITVILMQF